MDLYRAGATLDLATLVNIHDNTSGNNRSTFSVLIDHVFLPFTKSQTMRIRVPRPSPVGLVSDIPELAILKLYDRRWIDDRRFDEQPWSPAREEAAQARWNAIRSGELVDDFDQIDSDDYTECHKEERHRRLCKKRFESEFEAYSRLSILQGETIPRLYGAVMVSPSDITMPEAFVYGIIIENIDATPLDSLDPSSYPFPSSLGHSLMAGVSSFSSYGVIHNDIRSGNILISPTRIVLLDFGEATFRGENDDDEWWAEEVRLADEVEALRRILNDRKIRDRSPYMHPESFKQFSQYNGAVDFYGESWRKRWYDQDEVGLALMKERKYKEGPWWTLKKEVEEWLNSRPDPPEAFKVPRPGSPKIEKDSSVA